MIDEEHDASFKQDTAPRYHARDVAVAAGVGRERAAGARLRHAVARELARAQRGEYRLVEMPRRVSSIGRCRTWPRSICATQLHGTRAVAGRSAGRCTRRCSEALHDDGQVILLLNRRGYSTHIQCPACGHVVALPALRHRADPPSATEKMRALPLLRLRDSRAAAVSRVRFRRASATAGWARRGWRRRCRPRFPTSRACGWTPTRCASRAATSRRSTAFRAGEVQILLGTQMIAKGLDFPNVTLVGRDQRRHGAALARLPRRRADVSTGDAGGRPHRPRATRAAACWCRRSAPIIRRFWRLSAMISSCSPTRNCRCAVSSAIRRSCR